MIVSIKVPFRAKRGDVCKLALPLQPTGTAQPRYKPDKTLVQALAKAYYWQQLLDTGKISSIKAIARKYKVHHSYVSIVLQVGLLAPSIKRAILDGTAPRGMNLQRLKRNVPELWEDQKQRFL